MAEDYGVSLKITADTSDLDKVQQKVDETQQKIERPVEQPAPVKVTADTSAAERSTSAFFASFRRGVAGLRAAISSVFAAFGMVTFVVGGIMALVAGFQKLRDMATATSRAIAQMRWDSWVGGFNAAADAMIGKHQKIIALLKEEQDVANKAASLRTMETTQNRAQEDSARQQVRAAALAGATDPRERQRLEDQFAEEDERVDRQRFETDKRNRLKQLDEEESIFRSKEKGARTQLPKIDEEIANQENVVDIARKSIANGGDKEKNEKYIEDAKKRIASLKDEKKQVEDLIETMKREADYRQAQMKIVEQSKAPTGNQAFREARARAQEETDRRDQSDFVRERGKSAADAEFEDRMRAEQRKANAPGATEADRSASENAQIAMLREREEAATKALADAKAALDAELKKPSAERNEAAMSRAREDIRAADTTATDARRRREDLEASAETRRANVAQDYFGNLAQQIDASRPKSRLTAMGLGSGAPGDSRIAAEQANNVKLLVSISKQLLAATRDNKPDNVAVYAP